MVFLLLTPACGKPRPPVEIKVPTLVKLSPCPKPYSNDLGIRPWVPTLHMGHTKNVRVTLWNLEAMLLQIKLRDSVILCYEEKIK